MREHRRHLWLRVPFNVSHLSLARWLLSLSDVPGGMYSPAGRARAFGSGLPKALHQSLPPGPSGFELRNGQDSPHQRRQGHFGQGPPPLLRSLAVWPAETQPHMPFSGCTEVQWIQAYAWRPDLPRTATASGIFGSVQFQVSWPAALVDADSRARTGALGVCID